MYLSVCVSVLLSIFSHLCFIGLYLINVIQQSYLLKLKLFFWISFSLDLTQFLFFLILDETHCAILLILAPFPLHSELKI